jgi:hypothetical protein
LTTAALYRKRHGLPRPTERLREPRQDHKVGVKVDALKPQHRRPVDRGAPRFVFVSDSIHRKPSRGACRGRHASRKPRVLHSFGLSHGG